MKKSLRFASAALALTLAAGMTLPAFAAAKADYSKDETVYAVMNADGSIKSTTVSEHLYSASGLSNVTDESTLTDIQNTESDAAFTQDGEKLVWNTDDAELVVVAFGSMARIARSAVRKLREEGLKAGLFRPKTLYPFPAGALRALAPGRRFLVIEQNTGQMVEDVRLSLMGENARVDWHGVMPGLFIGADALEDPIRQACKEN